MTVWDNLWDTLYPFLCFVIAVAIIGKLVKVKAPFHKDYTFLHIIFWMSVVFVFLEWVNWILWK
jgi:hypothetical protein